jgi:Tol biopolymer transport system component/DNA-binding winged helix-turn-helix (wHTH) protein
VSTHYRWDDFVLDLENFRLEQSGRPLPLEPKAINLLAFLVQRAGKLVTKQEIFDALWPDTAVTDHALTRVVAQLRRALGDEAREAKYIETVPTRGYRWIRPLTTIEAPQAPIASASAREENTRELRPFDKLRAVPSVVEGRRDLAVAADVVTDREGGPIFRATTAVLLLVVVVLAALVWSQRGATRADAVAASDPTAHRVMWPQQITTRSGLELHPALAPAGDAIAYVSDRTGALEIYVRALDGTATDTALTSDGAENVQPAWSPDGRFIAYHSYRHGGVWVIPARGGVPRQVAPQGAHPAWAPDGLRIAFQSDEPADVTPSAWGAQTGSTLWIVDADGSNLKPLTSSGRPLGGHASPTWSRGGRYLAFTVFEGGLENGVWLLDIASGTTQPLARGPGLYELVFAADDRAIYAAGGEAFLMRIGFDPERAAGTGERELIPIAGVPAVRGLSISADGATIAFAGLALNSQIWMQPVRPDGTRAGDARAITSDTSRRNSLATMSPDGTKIAYMSTRGGTPPDVWVMNADGTEPIALTSDEAADGKPIWFPDSRRVAYMSNRNNQLGVWAVDVNTRRHELLFDRTHIRDARLIEDIGRLAEVHIAPSMTRVAFSAVVPTTGRRRLYVGTWPPLEARALTDGAESIGYPAWSPDERYIAVEIKDGSSMHAAIVDASSGAVRRLTNERGQSWVRSWSPDSRRVALAALRGGRWDLRWVDIDTGREEIIMPALPPHVYARYPEWSPRGDVVLFERGELRGNIWTLKLR